jgi:hypothetical protein
LRQYRTNRVLSVGNGAPVSDVFILPQAGHDINKVLLCVACCFSVHADLLD